MGKFIPELISILAPTTKKKERHDFTMKVKDEAIRKQKGKCTICGGYVNRWERDFHHQDGKIGHLKVVKKVSDYSVR